MGGDDSGLPSQSPKPCSRFCDAWDCSSSSTATGIIISSGVSTFDRICFVIFPVIMILVSTTIEGNNKKQQFGFIIHTLV